MSRRARRRARITPYILIAVAAVFAIALGLHAVAAAKAKAVSTDGEATVYLTGDFTKTFELAYDVVLGPAPHNRSWSTVSILLLGGGQPSGSLNVGLARGDPSASSLSGFIIANRPGEKPAYQRIPLTCVRHCTFGIQGDSRAVWASIQGRVVRRWARRSMVLRHPYAQLNGEVSAVNDSLSAAIIPLHVRAAGSDIHPVCAFTTEGIEARLQGRGDAIEMSGARRIHARVTYVALRSGKAVKTCSEARP